MVMQITWDSALPSSPPAGGNYLKLDKLAAIIIGASDLAVLKPAETF
jgi:hypothetical protein